MIMESDRPARQRHLDRAARLAALQQPAERGYSADELARSARERLWSARPTTRSGEAADDVVLRSGLLLRNGHPTSPLLDVSTRRGAGVQVLLLALFAAQCGPPARAGRPTELPLHHPKDATSTSWRYLVALPTIDTRSQQTASRSPTQNRLAQLRTALTCLYERGRIDLAKPSGRGRFEGFRLLDESTYRPKEIIHYRRPRSTESVVRVPAAFFLRGWVHVLNDGEIAAYLFLLGLQQRYPEVDPDQGLEVSAETWEHAFPTDRGHVGYRMLHRFGLIRVFRQDVRRDDGTIDGLQDGDFDYLPNEPLRFTVDVDMLENDALTQVVPALQHAAEGMRLDQAYAASRGYVV
jgi:hypothetical protein